MKKLKESFLLDRKFSQASEGKVKKNKIFLVYTEGKSIWVIEFSTSSSVAIALCILRKEFPYKLSCVSQFISVASSS